MNKVYALILALTLSACCTQRFQLEDTKPTIPTYEGTSHFIFWGIAQEKELNPRDVCGKRGIAAVETHTSFLNGLLAALTWGIYNPETYTIYCKVE